METTNKRQQTNYNKLVAEKDGEYIFCDYIFEHEDGFCGATGTILRPVTKDEYEEKDSIEGLKDQGYDEFWKQAVEAGSTEMGLDDWLQYVLDTDGVDSTFDTSGSDLYPQLREIGLSEDDFPIFDCSGGGRCFHSSDKYDKVYDKALLAKIRAIERKAESKNKAIA